jgi:cytoskeletal protein CcmA (bactofilin family)
MAKTQEIENNRLNVIGEGTAIQGNIQSSGDIRIDGTLKGNLDTKGKLVVGTSGNISGEVQCCSCEVSGGLDGKITVNELLILKSSANVKGDIITNKIAIEPNAIFTGTCNMDGGLPNTNGTKTKK